MDYHNPSEEDLIHEGGCLVSLLSLSLWYDRESTKDDQTRMVNYKYAIANYLEKRGISQLRDDWVSEPEQ